MLDRRTVLSLLALTSLTASCRLFRPVQPNTPARAPKPEARATQVKEAPAKNAPARNVPAKGQTGAVTDANIAAMVLASNNTDISYARLVPSRGERADVKEFARRMLTDHVGVNALVTDLLTKLDLAPEDNVASLDLRDESADKRDMMRDLSGYAFDSTYIENEVAYHRRFLASLDDVMLPRARDGQLRALLGSVRPAVAAHLAHAEQVRANVVSKK
jgi:putative membrane protein